MSETLTDELAGTAGLERVAAIARRLSESDGLDETLQRIVDLGAGYIEHCHGATLMLVRSGEVTTPASTGVDARDADMAQFRTGQGPCLSAMADHETIVVDDISAEARWPRWRDAVSDLGWRSMVGLRLFIADSTMGALDLYSRRAHGFDQRSRALAQVFASHAAVAMKAAISESGLHLALESRDVIGQAKGVLMERERLSGEQAFERLRRLSNDHNVKLPTSPRTSWRPATSPRNTVASLRRMEIWHNPRCSKSRATLGMLEDAGAAPDVRRYLDEPPSPDELRRVLDLLGMQPWELVRTGEDAYRSLGMADWDRTDDAVDEWVEAMASHPRLIERPVVIAGDRAVLGRPPEAVRDLLG